MFCSSRYNLEGWVQLVFMCCCTGHLLCSQGELSHFTGGSNAHSIKKSAELLAIGV